MMLLLTKAMIFLHMFVGVILIVIILLQRGRGGGLAGAFGGMGGQSAFGTKAGDVFTRITIVIATIWIVLGGLCILAASSTGSTTKARLYDGGTAADVKKAPAKDGDAKEVEKKNDVNPDAAEGGGMKPDASRDEKSAAPAESKPEQDKSPKDKDTDTKVNSKEIPIEKKAGDEPAAPDPQSSKSSEGKSDDGTSAPEKSVEK